MCSESQSPFFSKKKIDSPEERDTKNNCIHQNCSPEQRSLARKMGSSYSPKTPPTKKGVRKVRKKLWDETIEITLLHIAYYFFGNVPNLNR
jgi:hypothetical protein